MSRAQPKSSPMDRHARSIAAAIAKGRPPALTPDLDLYLESYPREIFVAFEGIRLLPLFLEKNSLIRVCKFPVLLRREFAWKPLNSLADRTSKSRRRVGFSRIPC